MNRLTKRGSDGIFLNKYNLSVCSGEDFYNLQSILDRLATYEDTGLEPEEIEDLKDCIEGEEGTQGTVKGLQSVYNQIINILKENNVLINITSPRPYLIKKDDEERINAEAEDLFKKCKIEEYNSKMKEKEAYKLYFDEAYKYTNFYEEGDE